MDDLAYRAEERSTRAQILRQTASITVAVAPFAVAFGVATRQAGMHLLEAIGFSVLVFGGSAQFAAVSVLADGGGVAAATIAGLLLNMRSLAFGVAMAPALRGPIWWRALVSQLMIDESTAVGTAQVELRWRRYGFLAGGLGVFVVWNLATIAGAAVVSTGSEVIEAAGFDATIGATFLALLWPRLADRGQVLVAVVGGGIALLSAPVLAPGLPIIAAVGAVLLLRPWREE